MSQAKEAQSHGAMSSAPPPYSPTAEVKYIGVSANETGVYLVRTDGIVDRSTGSGKVTQMMRPEGLHRFVSVSAGYHATYVLRSDGTVMRSTGSGKFKGVSSEIRPPAGMRYVSVSSGYYASYFVRSDGKVDRTKGRGKIESELAPDNWPNVKYVTVSAGFEATYLVRDDGKIDRFMRKGSIRTIAPEKEGTKYVYVGDQLQRTTSNGQSASVYGNMATYFIRDDGVAVRTVTKGDVSKTYDPPAGVRYISATSGTDVSYLVRSDGKLARITKLSGDITDVVDGSGRNRTAEDGCAVRKYIDASAGQCSYFLREDGSVDRTKAFGTIHHLMKPPSAHDFQPAGCALM